MALLSLVVGVLYVVFGLLRMGFIARFFAKPVLDGFIVGLGIFIAVGQLHKLVGVSQGSGDTVRQFAHVFAEFGSWNWPTVVGVSALAILSALSRFAKKVPGALVVVVLGIFAVHLFDLGNDGVALVGSVPTGFHFVSWSGITWADIADMVPGALGIIVVGYAAVCCDRQVLRSAVQLPNRSEPGVDCLRSGKHWGRCAAGLHAHRQPVEVGCGSRSGR